MQECVIAAHKLEINQVSSYTDPVIFPCDHLFHAAIPGHVRRASLFNIDHDIFFQALRFDEE
jgi:hypothetical protein